jgi:hypothetical protein
MSGVFKSKVPRRILVTKEEETAECWRKLHNELPHDVYCSPNITTVISGKKKKCVGHAACMGEKRTAYTVLV